MSNLAKKIIQPRDVLIERVAVEMAATWFEAAQNTPGMNTLRKKYRNDPKRYAQMNLEKFIPHAVKHLIELLGKPHISLEMKEEIYNALLERTNDPENVTSDDVMKLPNLDMSKLKDLVETKAEQHINQALVKKREEPVSIKTDLQNSSTTKPNPFKATRH